MGQGGLGRLYDRLAVPGQTLALNTFGLRNLRRMWAWNHYLGSIESTERMPRQDQIALTAGLLRESMLSALDTVPFYAPYGNLRQALIAPQTDPFAILGEFPILTRQEVMAAPELFLSNRFQRKDLVRTVTSGTTGTPFATWMEPRTFLQTDALWWRRTAWAGYRFPQWIARLVGDPIVPMRDDSPKQPYRLSWTDRRLYLSTFHLNLETAGRYLDVLERRQPEYLMGYPSSLEILAGYAQQLGRKLSWRPKAILFSSEPMFEHQREAILAVFPSRIVGLFGTAERFVSASQCESDTYHLSLVDGYVEGQFGLRDPVQPALMTPLLNRAMPLLRFQLGDHLDCLPELECPCGRTLPAISPVVTKQEDWLETPTGRRISPSALTWAFKDLPGVRRSQIVQEELGVVTVKLDVPQEQMTSAATTVRNLLTPMFFGEVEVRCVRDSQIEIMSSGKTRFVVRKLSRRDNRPTSI